MRGEDKLGGVAEIIQGLIDSGDILGCQVSEREIRNIKKYWEILRKILIKNMNSVDEKKETCVALKGDLTPYPTVMSTPSLPPHCLQFSFVMLSLTYWLTQLTPLTPLPPFLPLSPRCVSSRMVYPYSTSQLAFNPLIMVDLWDLIRCLIVFQWRKGWLLVLFIT